MHYIRKRITFLGLCVLILVTGMYYQASQTEPSSRSVPAAAEMSTEDQATTLELPGLDGDRYSLQSFLDKPLLLTFFTTWCSVCQEELPELSDMYEANEGAWNAVAVNASTQEHNKDAVRKFVQESEIAMPVLVDIGGEGLDTFQVNAVPLSFLIDKDGRIRKKFYGPVSAEQLKKELAKIAGS